MAFYDLRSKPAWPHNRFAVGYLPSMLCTEDERRDATMEISGWHQTGAATAALREWI